MSERLSETELLRLAGRVGGAIELVGPTKRKEVETSKEADIIAYLLADPSRIRRPIIDLGDALLLGWNAATRAALEGR